MSTSLLIGGADRTDAMILRAFSALRLPAAAIGTRQPVRPTDQVTHLAVEEIDIEVFDALETALPDGQLDGGHLVLNLCDPDDGAEVRKRWGAPLSPRSLLIRLLRVIDAAYERMAPRSIIIVLRPIHAGEEDRAGLWLGWLESLVSSWASRTGREVPFNTVVVSPDRDIDGTAAAMIRHFLAPDEHNAPAPIDRTPEGAGTLPASPLHARRLQLGSRRGFDPSRH